MLRGRIVSRIQINEGRPGLLTNEELGPGNTQFAYAIFAGERVNGCAGELKGSGVHEDHVIVVLMNRRRRIDGRG